ncbi:hypothetical protein D3C72_2375050 [compost metagenome]
MAEMDRAPATQPANFDDLAFLTQPVDHALHLGGVPRQNNVGQQRMRSRDYFHLVAAPATLV